MNCRLSATICAVVLLGICFAPSDINAANPPGSVPISSGTLFSAFGSGKSYTCFITNDNKTFSGKLLGGSYFVSFKKLKANATKSAKSSSGTKRDKFLRKAQTFGTNAKYGDSVCKGAGGGISPTPIPTTPPSSSNCYFDTSGRVTSYGKTLLGIPSSENPTISEGKSAWEAMCIGCHSDSGRQSRTVSQYRSATAADPMYFDESTLPNSTLYKITVYLNRFRPAC